MSARRRRRGNIRRIRQRRRRIFLSAALLCFIVWAGYVNLGKLQDKRQTEEAYAEQERGKDEKKENSQETEENEGRKVQAAGPVLAEESEKSKWYLRLVNAKSPMTEADVPAVAQETVDDLGYQVDARIVEDLQEMFDDARAAGRFPVICSAFRPWDTQVYLYNNKIQRVMNEDGLGEEEAAVKAATVVARPGTSEHQIGLALDIVSSEYQELDEEQMNTEDQKWLMENCWKYGFILRYPLDKSNITGVIFEPWHYRYVGKKAAKEITEQGLTLEEYLGAEPVGDPTGELG